MNSATLRIDLDSDYVLSDLETVRDGPFSVYYFEVFEADKIRFVINAEQYQEEIAAILREADAVDSVESLPDSQLLITKRSSGVLPIIDNYHGKLRRMSQFEGTYRTFDIVIFDRDDIKKIVEELENLGTVRLEQLRPIGKPTSILSPRQSEVLQFAYSSGYYDWPRRADAETLADQLDITHSTFLEHIRKAEEKILDEILGDGPPKQKITADRNSDAI